ncbi:MAG TPA: HEAT repeat domain-containing protein [Candidatus Acidoferrum sp.]
MQSTVIKWFKKLKLSRPGQLSQLAVDVRSPIKRRSDAIYLLGLLSGLDKLGDQERVVVILLLKVMQEDIPLMAWSAAVALAQIGDRSAVHALTQIATSDNAEETKRAAIYALGSLSDPRAAPTLVRILGNKRKSTKLRAEAAEALANCGYKSKRAITALTNALQDRSVRVKFFSAFALGQCARSGGVLSQHAVSLLQRLAKDRGVLPRFGSVAKEASRAIRSARSNESHQRL